MTYAAKNLSISRGEKEILKDASLEILPGRITSMIGPNGAGKSTLLRILSGEIKPDTGKLSFEGTDVSTWSVADFAHRRAVLPQTPSLSFDFLVREVVQMGLIGHSASDLVNQILVELGLDQRAEQKYTSLSGGEKQRVHCARAVVQILSSEASGSKFLFLDEPTASLDLIYTERLMRFLDQLTQKNVGIFMIMHDVNLASIWSEHILILKEGRIMAEGPPESVITPSNLEASFGVDASIIPHPQSGRPVMLPTSRE